MVNLIGKSTVFENISSFFLLTEESSMAKALGVFMELHLQSDVCFFYLNVGYNFF